ncbi:uncharacterized protein LOC125500370 [Athalia rosae]|uniref:uncharacterized protein LOC125500370 n=1 Tax=Athalia rosae TaxID=37344 RepID=UPI0020338752|nr:uncharacterized protein LOC125500370 [Athalia rosae]
MAQKWSSEQINFPIDAYKEEQCLTAKDCSNKFHSLRNQFNNHSTVNAHSGKHRVNYGEPHRFLWSSCLDSSSRPENCKYLKTVASDPLTVFDFETKDSIT